MAILTFEDFHSAGGIRSGRVERLYWLPLETWFLLKRHCLFWDSEFITVDWTRKSNELGSISYTKECFIANWKVVGKFSNAPRMSLSFFYFSLFLGHPQVSIAFNVLYCFTILLGVHFTTLQLFLWLDKCSSGVLQTFNNKVYYLERLDEKSSFYFKTDLVATRQKFYSDLETN